MMFDRAPEKWSTEVVCRLGTENVSDGKSSRPGVRWGGRRQIAIIFPGAISPVLKISPFRD